MRKRTEGLFQSLQRNRRADVAASEVAPAQTRTGRHKTKKVGQTLYLDPAVDDKLDEILMTRKGEISPYTGRRLRKHDLLLEALDLLFAETGEGSILSLAERE